jgi:hypothetical protein
MEIMNFRRLIAGLVLLALGAGIRRASRSEGTFPSAPPLALERSSPRFAASTLIPLPNIREQPDTDRRPASALSSPLMLPRAILIVQARSHIERQRGRLFQKLHSLPAGKLETLKELMADKEADLNLAFLPGRENETPEEIQQRFARARLLAATDDANIRNLLGEEDYGKYTAFQQSFAYQGTVEEIANVMRAEGNALEDGQQDAILEAYARAISTAAQSSGDEVSTEAIATMTDDQRRNLRDAQLARFDRYLAEELANAVDPETFRKFMAAEYKQETASP